MSSDRETDPTTQTTDPGTAEVHDVLATAPHGLLALTGTDGWPMIRALNYVIVDRTIYFHGNHTGEKMDALRADPRACFNVIREYALVPSHFMHTESACPATQYYVSVLVHGHLREIETSEEKAIALQSLMEKLQPEGKHIPIDAIRPMYRGALKATAVMALSIDRVAGKVHMGQKAAGKKRSGIEQGLTDRDRGVDRKTVERMNALVDAKPLQVWSGDDFFTAVAET